MREAQDDGLNKRAPHGGAGSQPLVVRHTENDFQNAVIEALSRLEGVAHPPRAAARIIGDFAGFDFKAIIALAAVILSLGSYVIQDARNSSRQGSEIEMTKVRVTDLERIATINTEARIRLEVELTELREGQEEIKRLLLGHENGAKVTLPRK
jgi:hypothetical protein